MRAPEFWWQERPSALARVLSPLGQAFGAITRRRMQQSGVRLSVPVICIGNFVAGGAGKTPTAIAIAQRLDARGEAPYFLSRGYGATARPQGGPILVDPTKHSASEVGDEPLLLARHAPTIVAADRVAAARVAIKAGASVLVMDDGLQNPALHKDLSIAVVDSETGVGNGLCIPAGPLRAPLADQLIGVDALVTVGDGLRAKGPISMARERALPVIEALLEPDASGRARLARQKVVAFAGIGRPEKFFKTLRELGANVAQALPFPDHHPYASADISMLKSAARQAGAMLVTTEKDYVRLQHLKDLPPIDTLAVTLETRQAEAFDQLLDDLLRA